MNDETDSGRLAICERSPLAHLAILWAASQPGIHSVLAGARDRSQMKENAAAMEGEVELPISKEMTRMPPTSVKAQIVVNGN